VWLQRWFEMLSIIKQLNNDHPSEDSQNHLIDATNKLWIVYIRNRIYDDVFLEIEDIELVQLHWNTINQLVLDKVSE